MNKLNKLDNVFFYISEKSSGGKIDIFFKYYSN